MTINQINGVNTNISYKGKPVRRIVERGYEEGYFMRKSPLSKDYVAPSRMAKICQSVQEFFSQIFNK